MVAHRRQQLFGGARIFEGTDEDGHASSAPALPPLAIAARTSGPISWSVKFGAAAPAARDDAPATSKKGNEFRAGRGILARLRQPT
ncbi:MAG TPA: hypothetical protein VKM93_19290 [Terriglobia bacterium]|nr:hypothetical protein [Terriglobia bacterium]